MIDWLRRTARETPHVELSGRRLPIVVRRLAQARRMTLRIAPDGSEVRVSLPHWGQTAEAVAFARSRQEWIERQLATVQAPPALEDGSVVPFRGTHCRIEHDAAASRRPILDGGVLRLGGPEQSLLARVRRWLEAQARTTLEQDLVEYCARAGVAAPKLALSNARRRWGSCSERGTIRINWRLMMAPDSVRRSVVAHEVAHLIHFDHSPRFHAALAELFEGDIAAANAWLKREGRQLYRWFG